MTKIKVELDLKDYYLAMSKHPVGERYIVAFVSNSSCEGIVVDCEEGSFHPIGTITSFWCDYEDINYWVPVKKLGLKKK